MLQVLIVFAVALLSGLAFMKAAGKHVFFATGRSIFNPLSYNFAIYLLTGFLGSIAIFIAPSEQSINTMVDPQSNDARLIAVLVMLYGAAIFLLTMSFSRNFIVNDTDESRVRNKPLAWPTSLSVTTLLMLSIIYYIYPRLSAITQVLFGGLDTWGVLALRASLVESEIDGFFIRRLIVEGMGWIFVLYLARIRRYRIQFFILTFAISFYFFASLAKIKVVLFVLSIFMAMAWDIKISIGIMVKYAISIFLVLIGIWAIFVGNVNSDYLFSLYSEGLVGRIIISEISALYPHLSIFGAAENFIGISSLSNLIASIFGETVSPRSGRIVLEITSPEWVAAGVGGVYNTVFFGEAYANFGYVGLLLSPIWVVCYYIFFIWASKFLAQPTRVAFLVHTALNSSVMAGFNDFLWNPFLIVTYVILFVASRTRPYISYAMRPTE